MLFAGNYDKIGIFTRMNKISELNYFMCLKAVRTDILYIENERRRSARVFDRMQNVAIRLQSFINEELINASKISSPR